VASARAVDDAAGVVPELGRTGHRDRELDRERELVGAVPHGGSRRQGIAQ
jgi:hypothetical protein